MADRIPTFDEVRHWCRVARAFAPWERAFWLGLLHDTVEDGYLPRVLADWWPALDAITRRKDEPYWDYVRRAAAHPLARRVKLADARDNWARPAPRIRYQQVIQFLTETAPHD